MTTIVLKTDVLRRAVANAALFAGTDDTLPALCAVRFVTEDDQLTIVATDRYILSWEAAETVKVAGIDDNFSLGIKDAKELIRLLPRHARGLAETTVVYDAEAGTVRFAPDAGPEITFRAVPGEYVRYRLLIDKFAPAERDLVALNPAYLAKFAKIDTGDKRSRYASPPAVRIELSDGLKPVRLSVGESFKAILVPVRLSA